MSVNKKCKVCKHPKVNKINEDLRNDRSLMSIHKQYDLSRDVLRKHKNNCLAGLLTDKVVKNNKTKGTVSDSLVDAIFANIEFARKLLLACDRELQDPDDPTGETYYLGARGTEIDVVYYERDEEGGYSQQKRKKQLQTLLDSIEKDGQYMVVEVNSKSADPRELLLKSIKTMETTAQLVIEQTQIQIENDIKNRAMQKANEEGGTITFEETVKEITKRLVIASRGNENQILTEIAGLPEITQLKQAKKS